MKKLCFILCALVPILTFTIGAVESANDLENGIFSSYSSKKHHNNKHRHKKSKPPQAEPGIQFRYFRDTLLAVMVLPGGAFKVDPPPPPSGFCCINPPTLTPIITTPDGRVLRGESITVNSLDPTNPTSLTFPGVYLPAAGTYTFYLVLDTFGSTVTITTQGPIPASLPVQISSSRGFVPQSTIIVPVFVPTPPVAPITEQYQFEASYVYDPKDHNEDLVDPLLVEDLLRDAGAL